jgi:hypothetical protein
MDHSSTRDSTIYILWIASHLQCNMAGTHECKTILIMGLIFISSHLSALPLTFLKTVQGCYRKCMHHQFSLWRDNFCDELFLCRTFSLCSKGSNVIMISWFLDSSLCARNWTGSDLRKLEEARQISSSLTLQLLSNCSGMVTSKLKILREHMAWNLHVDFLILD